MEAPALQSTPLNLTLTIADYFQYEGGRYQRYKKLLEFKLDAIKLAVMAWQFAGGGAASTLGATGYKRIDMGVQSVGQDGTLGALNVRASYTITGTEHGGNLTGAFADEPDGPILLTLFSVDAAGNSTKIMTHGAYLNRTGAAKDHPYCWLQNATRDWDTVAGWGWQVSHQYALAKVADLATTRVKPLTRPVGPVFSTPVPPQNLTRIELSPGANSNSPGCQPQVSLSGIHHTEARQNYFYADLVLNRPVLPLLDGPRGVCTTPYTTDIVCGRLGKVYGANPWQAWVMDWQGTKRTLYGMRHKYPPTWSETKIGGPEVETVGDWDASIPEAERYAWESWGMAWDTRSLFPIDDAAPIPPGETEHSHVSAGPVHFRTDRHGYVLRVQFDGKSHATPAKVTRWFAADDPWGIFYLDGRVYITERGKNRISVWSADTPNTYLGSILEDTTAISLGAINQQNRWWVGADATTCRTHSIVSPEGLAYLDGHVYFGSSALREVRRVKLGADGLSAGPVEVVCRPIFDGNSRFMYIAASPGTFGTRGLIAVTTWTVTNYGRPQIFQPIPGTAPDGAYATRSVTSDGATPILGKLYAAGVIVKVYDALDNTGTVTGTYSTQLAAQYANGTPLTHAKEWIWHGFTPGMIQGRGPRWESDSYGSAVAFGYEGNPDRPDDPAYGALVCSSANGNISVYCKADDVLDGPVRDSTTQWNLEQHLRRGTSLYQANLQVIHGPFGRGPDYTLPWGADTNVDAFLRVCGYSPDEEDPAMIAELQAALQAAQASLAAAQTQAAEVQTELDAANAQVSSLTSANAALTDKLAKVKTDLADALTIIG